MLKDFRRALSGGWAVTSAQLYLRCAVCGVAILNAVALVLCLNPPGGSQPILLQRHEALRARIAATRAQALRLQTISGFVQVGSAEDSEFAAASILPKRLAYSQVLEEIDRICKTAGLQEQDAVFSEEPIEGAPELAMVQMTANYQGEYGSFTRFLYEVDRSPMVLILDNLQASPQEQGGQIKTSIRFEAIVHESSDALEGRP